MKALIAQGHEAVGCPMLRIESAKDAAPALQKALQDPVQGLLMTSANGVREFAALEKKRDWPVYAVGDATAQAAKEAGFKTVHSAQGDVDSLATLVIKKADPVKGAFVHSAGSCVAGDLKGKLEVAKLSYIRVVTYKAEAEQTVPPAILADLKAAKYDGVLFYSPRTADLFAQAIQKAKAVESLKPLTAFALSQAVADKIKGLGFKAIKVAPKPEQKALLDVIGTVKEEKDAKTAPKSTAKNSVKDSKAAETGPTPKKAGLSWRTKLGFGAAAVVVIAAASAYGTQHLWLEGAKQRLATALSLPVAPTEQVIALEQRIKALENRPQATPNAADPRVAGVLQKLTALETAFADQASRLDSLRAAASAVVEQGEGQQAAAAAALLQDSLGDLTTLRQENDRLSQLVSELNNRLADVESAQILNKSASDNAQALIAAFSLLRETARTSSSYVSSLQAIDRLGQGDPVVVAGVARLQPLAAQGVPSRSQLRSDFEAVSKDLVRAQAVPADAGWVTQTVANITSLITIRPAADAKGGEGVMGAVAKALYALEDHDLESAVAALQPLEGHVKAVVQPWLTQAEQRVALDKTLQDMQGHILSLIGQGAAVVGGQG